MIGVPMPHPRDAISANLDRQIEHFFGTGKSVQEIEPGVTGEKALGFGSAHSNKLRAGRDRIAPALKTLAENGSSLNKAAEALGIDHKRARLIASENGFKFKS